MDWGEAIKVAKYRLNLDPTEYLERYDWVRVVKEAKEVLQEEWEEKRELEREYRIAEAQKDYAKYKQTPQWQKVREYAMGRAMNKCCDCGAEAEEVHHLSYDHINTYDELGDVIALCKDCHRKRHKIKDD
jgi:5-methylcytosine-specific restriction endonuclease McrA